MKVLSDKSTNVVTEELVLDYGPYQCHLTKVNGKTTQQIWRTSNIAESHPGIKWNPEGVYFEYYPNDDFINDEHCVNTMQWNYPESSLINDDDLEGFDNFDKLYCIRIDGDGYVYRIDKPYPIPMWKRADYIRGITNRDFYLRKAADQLSSLDFVREVEIKEIPSYNRSKNCNRCVEFEYKLPPEILENQVKGNYRNLLYTSTILEFDPFGLRPCLKGV